jgi:hypothetical protein
MIASSAILCLVDEGSDGVIVLRLLRAIFDQWPASTRRLHLKWLYSGILQFRCQLAFIEVPEHRATKLGLG